MPESFASSEDLGFVALSLPTGGSLWLAAAAIYAVEKDQNEDFSMVKTVGESIGVRESPKEIFDSIAALQEKAMGQEQASAGQIISNPIVKDGLLTQAGLEAISQMMGVSLEDAERMFNSEPSVIEEDEPDFDTMSDDVLRRMLLEQGVDSGTIETIIARRADDQFDQEAEQEFGDDLTGVMERMRQRDEEAGRG